MCNNKKALEVGKVIVIAVTMFIAYGLADHIQYSNPWDF
jgi:hypothetical protein